MATGTLSWVRESARAGSIAGEALGARGLLLSMESTMARKTGHAADGKNEKSEKSSNCEVHSLKDGGRHAERGGCWTAGGDSVGLGEEARA